MRCENDEADGKEEGRKTTTEGTDNNHIDCPGGPGLKERCNV